jgi:hypothetical protein
MPLAHLCIAISFIIIGAAYYWAYGFSTNSLALLLAIPCAAFALKSMISIAKSIGAHSIRL